MDIDNLEREKVEMKKRLDTYSKKSLLADLARIGHPSSSSSIAAVVTGIYFSSVKYQRGDAAIGFLMANYPLSTTAI